MSDGVSMTSYLVKRGGEREVGKGELTAAPGWPPQSPPAGARALSDNVRVSEHLEDLDLPLDLLLHAQGLDFLAIEDFDGHIAPCRLVDGHCAGYSGSGGKPGLLAASGPPGEPVGALWTVHFTFPNDPIPSVFFRRNWPILTVRSAMAGPSRPLPSGSLAGAAQDGQYQSDDEGFLSAQHSVDDILRAKFTCCSMVRRSCRVCRAQTRTLLHFVAPPSPRGRFVPGKGKA